MSGTDVLPRNSSPLATCVIVMTTVPSGKWIENVASNDKTNRAARKSLAARLAAVRHSLSRSARESLLEIDKIHQLRVSARRAAEAIKLYTDFLPRRRANWISKQLKRLRQSAGPVRDGDVLCGLLQTHTSPECPAFLFDELASQRRVAEKPVVAAYRLLRKAGRFNRRARALVARVNPRREEADNGENACFHDWARTKLRGRLQHFFDAAPAGTSDEESLHRFRIRAKKLRYAMELLSPAFPETFRTEIYPVVAALQSRLGDINDSRVACEYLKSKLSGSLAVEQTETLHALLAAWESRLERSRAEFFEWWTPQQAESLGDAFEEMLADREETSASFGYTKPADDEC